MSACVVRKRPQSVFITRCLDFAGGTWQYNTNKCLSVLQVVENSFCTWQSENLWIKRLPERYWHFVIPVDKLQNICAEIVKQRSKCFLSNYHFQNVWECSTVEFGAIYIRIGFSSTLSVFSHSLNQWRKIIRM